MKRIALLIPDSYVYAHNYFSRFLTASARPVWDGTEFILNPSHGTFDGAVVPQSTQPLSRTFTIDIPAGRSLLASLEPPDILFLPSGYVRQFGAIVGCDWRWNYARRFHGPAGHSWFVEINITEFDNVQKFSKSRLISTVTSAKRDTEQHRRRFKFLTKLKAHFGDQFDWFGRGVRELGERKLDGLLDYQYHIVIENGCWDHYWTEKLADAYVANCFPFYCGAPNITRYFAHQSMELISLDDVPAAIDKIETAIATHRYARAQSFLSEARNLLIHKYHPYQLFLEYLGRLPAGPTARHVFKPHSAFPFNLRDRIYNKLWNLNIKLHGPLPLR